MTAQVQRSRGKTDLSALDSKRLSPETVRRRKRVCQSCLWSTARVGEAGQFSMAESIGSEACCTAAASPPRRERAHPTDEHLLPLFWRWVSRK